MLEINDIINTIIQGNVLDRLKQIPSESINMVITSPPYWGLRNYNTDPQIWDGDNNCEHDWHEQDRYLHRGISKSEKLTEGHINELIVRDGFCSKCGAWKGELGAEPTFKLYIKHLCDIFDEVKRVLTIDGTCWINLGDSYAGSNQGAGTKNPTKKQASVKGTNYMTTENHKSLLSKCSIKAKSLIGIPDRFKIAMIDKGWICRNEIIWHKPNAMPESVKDRFTDDFEKLFFFTKNKKYYFEQQKERAKYAGDDRGSRTDNRRGTECNSVSGKTGEYKNKRSVWSINTKPFKEAHFAVYPEALIETPIKAGCPENGIVMDIFFGSGTSGAVAQKLNRNYIGIELNSEYIKIAEKRLKSVI